MPLTSTFRRNVVRSDLYISDSTPTYDPQEEPKSQYCHSKSNELHFVSRDINKMNATQGLLWRKCPLCNNEDSAPFLTKGLLNLIRCRFCSMIYANPVESKMALGSFYEDAGREYLASDKVSSDYADVRFERELRLFRSHCSCGSVLDVGCSSGGFLYQLNKRYANEY